MSTKPGVPPLSSSLIRQTTPRPPEAIEDGELIETADQGRGEGAGSRPARQRRRRPPAEGENRGRKLQLPDSVHDRLQLVAMQRRTTISAVATELLDRHLPRFRVEREG
jgi:hypothetical protein